MRCTPGATGQAPGSVQWVPESGETAWAVSVCWVTGSTLRLQVRQPEVEVGLLEAAVDLEQLAGDVLARGRGQVEHGGGDVLGLADPSQRRLGLELVAH